MHPVRAYAPGGARASPIAAVRAGPCDAPGVTRVRLARSRLRPAVACATFPASSLTHAEEAAP